MNSPQRKTVAVLFALAVILVGVVGILNHPHPKEAKAVSRDAAGENASPGAPEGSRPEVSTKRGNREDGDIAGYREPADSISDTDAFYAEAEEIDVRDEKPDAAGRFKRTRLIRKEREKYPLIRVEEEFVRNGNGEDRLVGRVAMVADHVMVSLPPGLTEEEVEAFASGKNMTVRSALGTGALYLFGLPDAGLESVPLALLELGEPPEEGFGAQYAEPDHIVHALQASAKPNDTHFDKLWGLDNTGQTGGTADADIDAPEAWAISTGRDPVVVGVIDTGVDRHHPDLAANIWVNSGEIPGNGVDDDGNGFIDDVHGYNFVANNANSMDDHYHGTHVAGTIGAVGDNARGIVGVARKVRLMPLKFLSASGSGTTSDAIRAIAYATANGAALTNNSWGGGAASQSLRAVIAAAVQEGSAFVAAAGNDSSNTDHSPGFPSSYDLDGIISVASSDAGERLSWFSNYGLRTVDLAAPGSEIYSTAPNNSYKYASGTSMACPHVAGAYAVLKSVNPALDIAEIKRLLMVNVDKSSGYLSGTVAGGRLNLLSAINDQPTALVSIKAIALSDKTADGAEGNGDGVHNPGENIVVNVFLENVGQETAQNVKLRLKTKSGTSHVTVTQPVSTSPDIIGGGVAEQRSPFRIQIAADAPGATLIPMVVEIEADGGLAWSGEFVLSVYNSTSIAGFVRDALSGAPVADARVSASGPLSVEALTATDGSYRLEVIDGSYQVRARSEGYADSDAVTVTVPEAATGIDFGLGKSAIEITPAFFDVALNQGQSTQRQLTVTNNGNRPLEYTILTQYSLASYISARGTGAVDSTGLPFYEDFESGFLARWQADSYGGIREIRTGGAAGGERSLFIKNENHNLHKRGMHTDLPARSRPTEIRFSVRPVAGDKASGFFVVHDRTSSRELIWFHAGSDGHFSVNPENGGDESHPYEPGRWHDIRFENINWTAKTFDYVVNGFPVKTGVGFRNAASVSEASRVYLYNFDSGSEASWDNIVLSEGLGWLSPSETSGTVAPGASRQLGVNFAAGSLPHADYTGELVFHTNVPGEPVTKVPATLRVAALPNTPPVASSQAVAGAEDEDIPLTLEGTDAEGNTLRARILSLPENGSLFQVFANGSTGPRITTVPATVLDSSLRLMFRPDPDAFGEPYASFRFLLDDGKLTSAEATVTLNVSPVNDAPVARDDRAYSRDGSGIAAIPVLLNDSDVETADLIIESFTQGSRGIVSDNGDGTLSYAPDAGFLEGIDTFTYTVSDGDGATATATVLIRVGYISGGNWETTGNGPGRSGFYDAYLSGNLFEPAWDITFEGQLGGSAIADGRIFTTRDIYQASARIMSTDLSTGALVWSREIPGQSPASVDPPTWNDGKLYFLRNNHSGDSQLWALNGQDGVILWNAPFAQQWERHKAPLVTDEGIWFNGGSYGGLYGYRKDGTRNFFETLPQYDEWTPATRDGSEIYSYVAGVFRSHDPVTGAVGWSVDMGWTWSGWSMKSVAALDSDRAYLVGKPGLHAVDLDTRQKAWTAAGTFSGSAAVANGRVYAISGGSVLSFDSASGQAATTYSTPTNSLVEQPIVTNDTLIVGSTTSTYVFDLATGTLLQTLPGAGDIALADGFLILTGTTSGRISAYRVSTGNNAAPVADAQSVSLDEDTSAAITLAGSDPDGELIYPFITRLPLAGVLYQTSDGTTPGRAILAVPTLLENPAGKLIYVPEENGFGAEYDSFGFKMSDGRAVSGEAEVSFDVNGINDAPVAVDDFTATRPGKAVSAIRPLLNDWDADGDTLVLESFTEAAHGTVASNGDGTLSYTPAEDFTEGEDVFQYTISDALGIRATASITVRIGAYLGGDWPTFGNDNRHTGYVPVNTSTDPWTETWSRKFGDTELNQVAIGEGKIFLTPNVYHQMSFLHGLDMSSGATLWEKNVGVVSSINPPTYFGGKVYFQNGMGIGVGAVPSQLNCVDVRQGETSWTAPIAAQWQKYFAPTVTEDGVWVNGGSYGGLYGFDPSGTQKFFQSLPQYDQWKAALDDDGTLLTWVAGTFRAHDPDSGALKWSVDVPGSTTPYSMLTAPVIGQRRAYLVGNPGLHCVHLDTHIVSWSVDGSFKGSPALANGLVYAVTTQGEIRAYNPTTGRLVTTYVTGENLPYSFHGQPVVTNDLLIHSSGTKTYFFELFSGVLRQTLNVGGKLSLAGDRLFIAGSTGTLHCYGQPSDNNPPVALASRLSVSEDGLLPLRLEGEDADGDPIRAIIRTLPANGRLYQTSDGRTTGALISEVPAMVSNDGNNVVFVPDPDGNGEGYGNFQFAFTDGQDASEDAVFAINVTPVNDAPRPEPDHWTARPGQSIPDLHVLANDLDIDGDAMHIVSFTAPSSGLVERDGNTLSYAPDADMVDGTDSFTYTVADPAGLTATATVTIEISATLGTEWRMLGNDAKHSGHVPVNLGPEPWQPGWTREINPSGALYQVAVGGGGVYVTYPSRFDNATIHALEKNTGATLWTLPLGAVNSVSPPAYGDGTVYVEHGKTTSSSPPARLIALDAASGENSWIAPVAAQWETYRTPTFAGDSVWVNGGSYGGMYGFNRTNGAQLFFKSLAQRDMWTPAHDGTHLYSSIAGEFEVHDPVTGARVWKTTLSQTGEHWYSADQVVLGNGYACFIRQNADLYCVNLSTRELQWRLTGPFTGIPAIANGRIYASRTDGNALSIDVATGRILKTYPTGQNLLTTQPLVSNDLLFIGSGNGYDRKTWIFDIFSGELLHTMPLAGEFSLADGTLYIAADNGTLHTFGRPNPDNSAPVAVADSIVIEEDHETPITLEGSDADGDILRFVISRLPAHGKIFQTDADGLPTEEIAAAPATVKDPGGRVFYRPEPDGSGVGHGSFAFFVSDGFTYSEAAEVGIDVMAVNDAPVARDDFASTAPGQLLSPVHVLYNDTDVDGDPITLVSFTQSTHGAVSLNPAGGLAYMPHSDVTSAEDSFTYIIRDPSGETASASVRVSISSELGKSWPTFGGGPSHSGHLPVNLGTGTWTEGWTKSFGGAVQQVAVADGSVVVVPKIRFVAGFAASLDAATGTELWRHVFAESASLNPPSLHNGRVYLQRGNHGGDTQLWSLDAATGTPVWNAPFGAQWETYFAPAVTDSGIWINGGSYGGIYGFNPDGTRKFFESLPQYDDWTPSIGPDGTVYSWVAGVFTAHDPDTGEALWKVNVGWEWRGWSMNTIAAIGEGRAFVIGNRGLHAVDLVSRSLAWSVEGNFTGSPSVSGGVVCAILGSEIHEYSVTDGQALGVYRAPGTAPLVNQPITTNDLLIASSASHTYVFERYTGQLLQTLTGGGELSLAGGRLYAAGADGTLQVFDAPWAVRFSPDGGQSDDPIEVTLTASDPEAEIFYSLDGSPPQFSRRKTASGGTVVIEKSSVMLAVSVSADGQVSPVKRAEYVITDSDRDGLADWWERLHFGSLEVAGSESDFDNDGILDMTEFTIGSIPGTGSANTIHPTVAPDESGFRIDWQSVSGKSYVVESTCDMVIWTDLSNELTGTGGVMTYKDPGAIEGGRCFYRIRIDH